MVRYRAHKYRVGDSLPGRKPDGTQSPCVEPTSGTRPPHGRSQPAKLENPAPKLENPASVSTVRDSTPPPLNLSCCDDFTRRSEDEVEVVIVKSGNQPIFSGERERVKSQQTESRCGTFNNCVNEETGGIFLFLLLQLSILQGSVPLWWVAPAPV